MGALLIVATFAAQAAAASASPASTDATAPTIHPGQTSYVDLEGGVGYSTNPQLAIINDQSSAYGRVALHAVHSRVSARSTTVLSGYAENVSYTNHQGSQQSLNLYARHDTAVSEHTRLFGDVSASYQEGGQLDTRILGVPLVPPLPGGTVTPPILILPGGDFLSVTGREYSLAAHGGGTFTLGPRDSLSISSGVEHVVFHSALSNTAYTMIPVSVAYDRTLSARTTVGARLVAQDTEYNGPANFHVITPQLTGRMLLAERLTFSGAIGVSFARIDNGLIVRRTTGLAGEANLCGQGETSFFCARVAADEQTATTAGPARSLSAGVDFTRRLDADQTIQFSLGATRYSTPTSVVVGRNFSSADYFRGATAYTRRLGTRLFGGINLAARKLTQNGPDPKTDLNASLFIRYRLGDVQ
jgi:hypothetical protein